jgi:hypothetical protein
LIICEVIKTKSEMHQSYFSEDTDENRMKASEIFKDLQKRVVDL